MSKLDVTFIHLHAPLFFAKKNFKEKIDSRIDKGPQGGAIEMEYDRSEKELCLKCEGHTAYIPSSNIVSYQTAVASTPAVNPIATKGPNTRIRAQASTPHDHVFAGQGAGQVKS